MARTLSSERQILKQWAIILAALGMKQDDIDKWLGVKRNVLKNWLKGRPKIVDDKPFILDNVGRLVHNSGVLVHNFRDGLPPNPKPQLFFGRAENLHFLPNESVNIIITSPPYNLGQEKWPMGGNGRTPRQLGVGYSEYEDSIPEDTYEQWQIQCLNELYRVAKGGASLFYNHKIRQRDGEVIHPVSWLQGTTKWQLRQEIIWDRLSTHNHTSSLFWPQDERIYWLTKGKPNLPDKSINIPSVWREFGPIPKTNHPAPFTPALPRMILKVIGKPGDVVLDPFGGGMTTCLVASAMGFKNIGVDSVENYVAKAAEYFGVPYGRG